MVATSMVRGENNKKQSIDRRNKNWPNCNQLEQRNQWLEQTTIMVRSRTRTTHIDSCCSSIRQKKKRRVTMVRRNQSIVKQKIEWTKIEQTNKLIIQTNKQIDRPRTTTAMARTASECIGNLRGSKGEFTSTLLSLFMSMNLLHRCSSKKKSPILVFVPLVLILVTRKNAWRLRLVFTEFVS